MGLPKVAVISLGGTIAMAGKTGSRGVVPSVTAEDLTGTLPQLAGYATIECHAFSNIPSPHLTFSSLLTLGEMIRKLCRQGMDGIVLTQGTDTIEETAYFLDRVLDVDAPVVVTGAMRHLDRPSPDGPANLLASVQVAVDKSARGLGVLVVFNEEIHAARFVVKSHASNVAAFSSAPLGPVGWVVEDRPRVLFHPLRLPILEPKQELADDAVGLIRLHMGVSGRLIDAAADAGFAGLVVEAMGGGHASISASDAVERAASRLPVVLVSRTGRGEALRGTYGFVGSETDLLRRGLLPGGTLNGARACVALWLLLSAEVPRAALGDHLLQ